MTSKYGTVNLTSSPEVKMAHLWPMDWYDLEDGEDALRSIARHWAKVGYDTLNENDYARLEPFLEPFDGIYTEGETVILSRVGNNGVQKEFCQMYVQPAAAATGVNVGVDGEAAEDVWVLEWFLNPTDIRRVYLHRVADILYGKHLGEGRAAPSNPLFIFLQFLLQVSFWLSFLWAKRSAAHEKGLDHDETQCMIMLTHALSSLRQLKLTMYEDEIVGELDDEDHYEVVQANSFEGQPEVIDLDE